MGLRVRKGELRGDRKGNGTKEEGKRDEAAAVMEGSGPFRSSEQVSGKKRKAIPVSEEAWKPLQLCKG